jgi:hypothetical protein
MSVYSKVLLAALAALTTLAFAVGTATARRIAVDDQDIDVIWDDNSQRLTFDAGGNNVSCEVTLLGSFHSLTIAKVANTLIGHITHVAVDTPGCIGGSGRALTANLPWHVTYRNFSGVLPNITLVGINLLGAEFLIDIGETECLGRTEVTEPGIGNANVAGGQLTTLEASGVIDINDLNPFAIPCDFIGDGEFSGTGRVRDLEGNLVLIRLVL